jgi:hypothetical protein
MDAQAMLKQRASPSVDHHVIGRHAKSRQRTLHSQRARLIDIDAVDLAH